MFEREGKNNYYPEDLIATRGPSPCFCVLGGLKDLGVESTKLRNDVLVISAQSTRINPAKWYKFAAQNFIKNLRISKVHGPENQKENNFQGFGGSPFPYHELDARSTATTHL